MKTHKDNNMKFLLIIKYNRYGKEIVEKNPLQEVSIFLERLHEYLNTIYYGFLIILSHTKMYAKLLEYKEQKKMKNPLDK